MNSVEIKEVASDWNAVSEGGKEQVHFFFVKGQVFVAKRSSERVERKRKRILSLSLSRLFLSIFF